MGTVRSPCTYLANLHVASISSSLFLTRRSTRSWFMLRAIGGSHSYTSLVIPGIGIGPTGFGPSSIFAGLRSSFDAFMAQSHFIALPV